MGFRRLTRLAIVDITPLREVPGYRWFFAGMFFTHAGRQLAVVAVPFQVYDITGSTLLVGLLGLAQLVPLLLVSVVAGALADAFDRRRLLVFSQIGMAATALGMLWNSVASEPLVWPLFVLVAFNAGISAIDSPARHAIVPRLVGRSRLPSTLALNSTLGTLASATIPALGGLLIAVSGFSFTYGVEAAMFAISGLMVSRIPDLSIEGGGRQFGLDSILEGFRFLRTRPLIQGIFLLDFNAMVFGMPSALFPAFGTENLGGDAVTVGLLYAAPGIGALIAAVTSGWVSSVRRHGRAVVVAIIIWGLAITVFGFSESMPVALTMLAVAGAADVASAIFRQSILQLSVPDDLRGRLSSMHSAVAGGGPALGDLEAGVVASLVSVRFSVISGGLACFIGAFAIARWRPQVLGYTYDPNKPETE